MYRTVRKGFWRPVLASFVATVLVSSSAPVVSAQDATSGPGEISVDGHTGTIQSEQEARTVEEFEVPWTEVSPSPLMSDQEDSDLTGSEPPVQPPTEGERLDEAEAVPPQVLEPTGDASLSPELQLEPEAFSTFSVLDTSLPSSGPVPRGYARVVVQVGGDLLLDGVSVPGQTQPNPFGMNDRMDAVDDVSPATGATLRLLGPANNQEFGSEEANKDDPGPPINEDWARCRVDSNGECVFLIPVTGDERRNYYWVTMEDASPGFSSIETLRVGGSGAPGTFFAEGIDLRYAYATPLLKSGNTYYSGQGYSRLSANRDGWGSDWGYRSNSFMDMIQLGLLSNSVRPRSSLGIVQQVRDNPPPVNRCQLDIGIMMDLSGSVGNRGAGRLRDALTTIVDTLEGSSSTLGLGTFSSTSPRSRSNPNELQPHHLNDRAHLNQIRSYIKDTVRGAGGGTNWEAGFRQLGLANEANPQNYDVVFFITDGNPTVYDRDGRYTNLDEGSFTDFRHIEAGIAAANLLKAQGTRVVAVGTPSRSGGEDALQVSEKNLAAISGPIEFNGTNATTADYFRLEDDSTMGQLLLDSIKDCGIEVEKRIVDEESDAPHPTIDNTLPGGEGWKFSAKDLSGVDIPGAQREKVTNAASRVRFNYSGAGAVGDLSIVEDLTGQEEYSLVPAASGKNAVCINEDTGRPLADNQILNINDAVNPGFRLVGVSTEESITCTVFNEKKPEVIGGTLNIVKVGAVGGTSAVEPLSGSEFMLVRLSDGVAPEKVIDLRAGEEGRFNAMIEAGEYRLIETRAPENHILLAAPIDFVIEKTDSGGLSARLKNPEVDSVAVNVNNQRNNGEPLITIQVANLQTGRLPETGGSGAGMHLLLGLLVAVIGVVRLRARLLCP